MKLWTTDAPLFTYFWFRYWSYSKTASIKRITKFTSWRMVHRRYALKVTCDNIHPASLILLRNSNLRYSWIFSQILIDVTPTVYWLCLQQKWYLYDRFISTVPTVSVWGEGAQGMAGHSRPRQSLGKETVWSPSSHFLLMMSLFYCYRSFSLILNYTVFEKTTCRTNFLAFS